MLQEVFVAEGFGADEAAFEVGVDHACALRSLVARVERPGAAFLFAGGKERAEAEDFVTLAHHGVEARFLHAEFLEEFGLVGGFHGRKFFFDLAADHDDFVAVLGGVFLQLVHVGVAGEDVVFLDVRAVEERLCGKEGEVLHDAFHFFTVVHHGAGGLAFLEGVAELFASGEAGLGFGTTHAGGLGFGGETLFDGIEVLQDKFGLDDFYVADRVHGTVYVHDVFVVEATDYFHDGFAFADVREELVAEAFALGGTLHETCNVHEFRDGGDDGFRIVDLDQFVEAAVRHAHHAHVRFDGAEGIVRGFGAGVGDGVKDGGLAYVREAYDTAFKTHDNLRFMLARLGELLYFCDVKVEKCPCRRSHENLNLRPFLRYGMAGQSSKTNIDMLNGPLGRKILRFAIPIALSSIFQQMFNLADVAVVGQFAGDKALAAVGANTFVINMLINLFVGISVGANVVVANSIGERNYRSVTRSVHTSVMVAFFSGIFLSFVGIFFARPILELISTPSDVLDMAVLYLQIYFVGMPFVMIYNFVSAVLRSKGDTKRPLYVLMVAGAVNVVLNLILVAGFGMGVSGVAIATVIANTISGVTLFYLLLHEVGPFKLQFWKLRVTPFFLSRILRVGIPTGIRGVVFSFSNVCLQSAINSLGSATVAASAIALNYEFVVYYWLNSFSQACVTFVGQNFGAKNMDRCRRTVRWTLLLGCSTTIVLSALCCIFARPMLSVFTSNTEIIEIGSIRMQVVVGLLAINVFLDVFAGALSGMGKSLAPALTCMVGVCGIRILWVIFVFPKYKSFASLMVVYPVSWILTISVIMGIYFYHVRRTKF